MTHKIWLIIMVDHFFGSFRAGSAALRLSISSFRFFLSSSFDLDYKNILVAPNIWAKKVARYWRTSFNLWTRSVTQNGHKWPISTVWSVNSINIQSTLTIFTTLCLRVLKCFRTVWRVGTVNDYKPGPISTSGGAFRTSSPCSFNHALY